MNKIKKSRTGHGIELEIFDSYAISELLADPEVFWIATRFLSIPSDVFLQAPPTAKLEWYEEAKKLDVDGHRSTAADFLTVKRAIRFATKRHELHSDLPTLLGKLRIFQVNPFPGIARRAFYEEFVASLRGREFVKDCAGGLQQYFAAVPNLTETAEIEDAAVLIHYAFGARNFGLLDITLAQILVRQSWPRARSYRPVAHRTLHPGARCPGNSSASSGQSTGKINTKPAPWQRGLYRSFRSS
jgi:hypothetical protein